MKNSILICLSLLFSTQNTLLQGKQQIKFKHPVYFTMEGYSDIKIERVKTNKKTTTLYFYSEGAPSSCIHISSPTYLVDEEGKRHKMLSSKNIVSDKPIHYGKKGKIRFQISFDPLPSNTKRFDMIEDYYNNLHRELYCIRESGTPFVTNNIIDTVKMSEFVAKTFPDSIFIDDSLTLTGHFDSPDILKRGKVTLQIEQMKNYFITANNKYKNIKINVDSSGFFNARIPVIGPSIEKIIIRANFPDSMIRIIPVMLYPGDNLRLRICDLDRFTQHVEYQSEKVDFCNLLNHTPSFVYPGIRYMSSGNLDASWAMDSINRHIDNMDSLALYIANKYSLNKIETQQLRTETSISGVLDVIYTLNDMLRKRSSEMLKRNRGIVTDDVRDTMIQIGMHPCYNVLSRIRAYDNTFMTASNNHIFFRNLISSTLFNKFYSDPTMGGRFPNLGENGENVDYYSTMDSTFVSLLSFFRHKSIESDAIFEQSFILYIYLTYFENNPLQSPNKTNLYRKIIAMKNKLITLPVLQSLLKMTQKDFVDW